MNYSDFIRKMEDGEYLGGIPISLLWEQILTYLKDGDGPFLQHDFEDTDPFTLIMKQIEETADLEDYEIDAEELEGFWNESLRGIITQYNASFNDDIVEITTESDIGASVTNGKIPMGTQTFSSEDIKNADAGRAFVENITEALKWVRPWYNVEFDSYYGVRSGYLTEDNNISKKAIGHGENLQFTREFDVPDSQTEELHSKWIRLLMPQNSRRVEVEDLNRNFWVISSVLAGACSYIFDPNSPIGGTMRGMSDEIMQLWENIIYLWTTLTIMSQKQVEGDVRVLVMPVPNSSLQPYTKYDNFTTEYENVFNRLQSVVQRYKHSNLCIIAYERLSNYYKNCYDIERYSYICLYNAKKEKIRLLQLKLQDSTSIDFKVSDYKDMIYTARETDSYYRWSYPLERITTAQDGHDKHRFFGAIRVIPHVTAIVNDSGDIEITDFSLSGIDAIRYAIAQEEHEVIRFYKPLTEIWTEQSTTCYVDKTEPSKDIDGTYDIYDGAVDNAYYLGEIPSWSVISAGETQYLVLGENMLMGSGILLKIGNFLPTGAASMLEEDEHGYTNADIFEEQSPPPAVSSVTAKTAYEANLTIKGGSEDVQNIENWYGGLGTAHIITPQQSYYYVTQFAEKTVLNENNESETIMAPVYSKDVINDFTILPAQCGYQEYTAVTLNFLQRNGWDVVKNYVSLMPFDLTTVTYFITSVGIRPWHNTENFLYGNGTFQGYYTHNLLTHLFRFIPFNHSELVSTTNAEMVYDDNGQPTGYVEYLGPINKTESAFGQGIFQGTTTWRLPKLIPEEAVSALLGIGVYTDIDELLQFVNPDDRAMLMAAFLAKQYGVILNYVQAHLSELVSAGMDQMIKYLDISNNAQLQEYYANQDYEAIITYIKANSAALLDTKSIENRYFNNPSGTWTVFDGNVTSPAGNMESYDEGNHFRQAVHMDFTFVSGTYDPQNVANTKVRAYSNPSTLENVTTDNTQATTIWSANYSLPDNDHYPAGNWNDPH